MKTKIGFISDLHYKSSMYKDLIRETVKEIASELDYLIIAGDISSDIHDTLHFLKGIPNVRFVPGNHDMYKVRGKNSKELYTEYLNSSKCLITNPLVIGNTVILGDTGWYDYSTQAEGWSLKEIADKRYNGITWVDKLYFNWPDLDDQELAQFFCKRLEMQMSQYRSYDIIPVTHIVPFKEFVIRKNEKSWDFFGAYIGCQSLGELYKRHNVKTAVFGHTHFRMDEKLNGIHCLCRPLGMEHEWKTYNVAEEIRDALYIMEI